MNCPYCIQGYVFKKIKIYDDQETETEMKVPCDECGGTGALHCCEGLMEHE